MIHDPDFKDERIPCPYDPNHTVWKKDLNQHLKKCNHKPKERTESWFNLDFNTHLKGTEDFVFEDIDEENDDDKLMEKYISILKQMSFEPLQYKIYQHEGLESRLNEKSNQKHPIQQNSIIANLDKMGLLNESFLFLEFGCGKGELSRYLNQCILQQNPSNSSTYGFGLIDRGKNRLKADSKIISDCDAVELTPQVKRSKIDIKDLNLSEFISDLQVNKVVGISKHLCGAATDLTLKSILNSTILEQDQFGGVLIAMCCRHACSLEQLLPQSKKYLYDKGFKTVKSFKILKKLVSWAVDKKTETQQNGLSFEEREEIGLTARRLIDESRVHALRSILGEQYKVEIFCLIP
ncbi:hypothetical protein G210_0398 [Candida maltosa Xu316]|uniref:tRNA:m(4)X modification enzyme TRM13 n=1 Tax=Candida maltosa (strain Xu316) TaxID=1245528 RepID=M3HN89_CANMX|nr:hypothetical protein G210_0398 [Candida maltosa Xu316]